MSIFFPDISVLTLIIPILGTFLYNENTAGFLSLSQASWTTEWMVGRVYSADKGDANAEGDEDRQFRSPGLNRPRSDLTRADGISEEAERATSGRLRMRERRGFFLMSGEKFVGGARAVGAWMYCELATTWRVLLVLSILCL